MRRVLACIGSRLAEACAWQSAAMFAVKITGMVRLKQQWEEHQRLEAEHAELVAELEAAISPENAAQVETILTKHERRRTSLGGGLLAPTTPRKTKAPTEDATSGSSRRGLPALSTNLTEREYTSSLQKLHADIVFLMAKADSDADDGQAIMFVPLPAHKLALEECALKITSMLSRVDDNGAA